jgi:UDP-N-acetylmuramate--alanine ligase
MRTCMEAEPAERRGYTPDFEGMRVHLIGVGGSGMTGAASLLLAMGADLSGSDLVGFEGMGDLVSRGARLSVGHRAEQLEDGIELVVTSAAIPTSNPELAAAHSRGIPVMKYAELLGVLMQRAREGVAIAGTHGKTSTTAMCAYLCREGGLDPSFLTGACSPQLGGSSGLGRGPHFIAESCEFDRSFLRLAPRSAAILNIESDHFDCYRDLDDVIDAFRQFARNVHPNGLLIGNGADVATRAACAASEARVELFGIGEPASAGADGPADWQATDLREDGGCYAFDIRYHGETLVSTKLSIPGRHSVANALSAAALAYHAGVDPARIGEALSSFSGVSRRMTWRGEGRGVTIIDDYAHHPTEIRATIEAAVGRYRPKRTWAVFQPHQRTRTQRLMADFATAFGGADEIIVPDVYAARESSGAGDRSARTETPCAEELALRIRQVGGRANYVSNLGAVADHVARHVTEGDLVLTMGAGDVWKVADELVKRICGPDRA